MVMQEIECGYPIDLLFPTRSCPSRSYCARPSFPNHLHEHASAGSTPAFSVIAIRIAADRIFDPSAGALRGSMFRFHGEANGVACSPSTPMELLELS